MKKVLVSAILSALAVPSLASAMVTVTTIDELKAALKKKDKDIQVPVEIVYSSSKPLKLVGKGHTLTATGDHNLLKLTGGANLIVSNLNFTVADDITYGWEEFGQVEGGRAILHRIPFGYNKNVKVAINKVTVEGFGDHGIHISECEDDDCAAGQNNDDIPQASTGSIILALKNVVVKGVGFGQQDADGIRVDERSQGNINMTGRNLLLQGVGADGIELDETGPGNVKFNVKNAVFEGNGTYCEPARASLDAVVNSYFADVETEVAKFFALGRDVGDAEGDLEDYLGGITDEIRDNTGTVCIDEIDYDVDVATDDNDRITGVPTLVEIASVLDLDDAFDIDEAGDGSIIGTVASAHLLGNTDEGLDFDEAGNGGANVKAQSITAENNSGEGMKVSEEDAGGILATIKSSVFSGNNGKKEGVEIESEDEGKVRVVVNNSQFIGGDQEKLKVEGDAGFVNVRNSDVVLDLDDGIVEK